MSARSGPVYESRVFFPAESVADFDAWAEEALQRACALPGVVEASSFATSPDLEGRQGRTLQFVLEDDEALERFIEGLATEMEADALDRFGDRFDWCERILREDSSTELPAGEMPECLNCGAHLRGQYCWQCGQRAQNRLISLWELLREAFGDLLELDSRLWRTVVPLLAKPGLLTHDYLQGRRARYMPPFRMYLVLSLLFFLVAFFNPRETFSIFYDPQTLAEAEEENRRQAEEEAETVREELASEGVIVGGDELPEELHDHLREDLDGGFNIRIDDDTTVDGECNVDDFEIDGPEWLKRRLTPERVVEVCEQVRKDGGRQFVANLVDNIPIALIVLLPIMAFVLKALYPLSRRYYVEHLLFFVHFHAFFFLMLILQIVLARSYAILPIPDAIGVLVIVAASFYVPVYLFVAMRRVYGQGRAITALKFIVLTVSYLAGFTVTMLGAVTMAAFSA
jgi:nucleotide-binding universal stress UspA family protein